MSAAILIVWFSIITIKANGLRAFQFAYKDNVASVWRKSMRIHNFIMSLMTQYYNPWIPLNTQWLASCVSLKRSRVRSPEELYSTNKFCYSTLSATYFNEGYCKDTIPQLKTYFSSPHTKIYTQIEIRSTSNRPIL